MAVSNGVAVRPFYLPAVHVGNFLIYFAIRSRHRHLPAPLQFGN